MDTIQIDETAYQQNLDKNKPVIVTGVSGNKSKSFTKKFKTLAHFHKWYNGEIPDAYAIRSVANESCEEEIALEAEDVDLDETTVKIEKSTGKKSENQVSGGDAGDDDESDDEADESVSVVENTIITPYGQLNAFKDGIVSKHKDGSARSIRYEAGPRGKIRAKTKEHKSHEDAVAHLKAFGLNVKTHVDESVDDDRPDEDVDSNESVVSESYANKYDSAPDNVKKVADEMKRLRLVSKKDLISSFPSRLNSTHLKGESKRDIIGGHLSAKFSKKDLEAHDKHFFEESADQTPMESLELVGDKTEITESVRKIDGAFVTEEADVLRVTYHPKDRDLVVENVGDSLISTKEVGLHLVKEDAGKSFFRVLTESGFETEQLSDLASIFEAAVNERIASREAEFDAKIEAKVVSETRRIAEEIDMILAERVADWLLENKVSIASRVRLSIAEELAENIGKLVAESGITLPESKIEALERLEESVVESKSEIEKLTEERDELVAQIEEFNRERIVFDLAEEKNLSAGQRNRLVTMLEDFDGDLDSFERKANVVVRSFFESKTRRAPEPHLFNDVISESAIIEQKIVPSTPDSQYASFLKRNTIKIGE